MYGLASAKESDLYGNKYVNKTKFKDIVSMCQMESREYIFIALQELFQNVLRVIQLHSTILNRSAFNTSLGQMFLNNSFHWKCSSKVTEVWLHSRKP